MLKLHALSPPFRGDWSEWSSVDLKAAIMSDGEKQNANPIVYSTQQKDDDNEVMELKWFEEDEEGREVISKEEVFEHIRHLNDPEHPLTLEQLNVTQVSVCVSLGRLSMSVVFFLPDVLSPEETLNT